MRRHLHTFWAKEGGYLDAEWLGARYVPRLMQDWGCSGGFWLVGAVSAVSASVTPVAAGVFYLSCCRPVSDPWPTFKSKVD
jgi:hypothetical protein